MSTKLVEKNGIFILTIPTSFTLDTILAIESHLDTVDSFTGPCSLIICSSHPKVFSGGISLKSITDSGLIAGVKIGQSLAKLCSRLLMSKIPTVAAINGHVVAGGFLFALSLDYRVMNQNHGVIKMNEVELGIVITRGGIEVLKAKVSPTVHRDLIFRAKTFNAQEAVQAKIVDYAVDADQVMTKSLEIAEELKQFGEKKEVYEQLKSSCYYEHIKIGAFAEFPLMFVEAMKVKKNPQI